MNFLKFDDTRDFPYYNHNPRLSKDAWFLLMLSVVLSSILYVIVGHFSEFIGSAVFCFTMLIPLLYFSNWDYTLLFHKPSRNEIILAVLMFCGYIIYAAITSSVLDLFIPSESSIVESVNIEMIVSLIFSMMAEELLKFIPLMFFMRVIYKYTSNVKTSLYVSSAIILIYFGLIHYDYSSIGALISCLVLQGLGTVFELYGYIKTKNLFVPYLSHLLTDAFLFILMFLGLG